MEVIAQLLRNENGRLFMKTRLRNRQLIREKKQHQTERRHS